MQTIDEYIATFPPFTQEILQKIRAIIHENTSEATEAISYGIPTFKLGGANLVHFAGYAKHIGFYPTPSILEAFGEEIRDYKSAKGSVQFSLTKPIPYELIASMVCMRIHLIPIKK